MSGSGPQGQSQGGQKGPAAWPSQPTAGAKAAARHAGEMLVQTDPPIWFDSWSNDGRDNNFDGNVDDAVENVADGSHYDTGGPYYGWVVSANWLTVPHVRARFMPNGALEKIKVEYKVCIDVPRESYIAARVPIPSGLGTRNITSFFGALKGDHSSPGALAWMVHALLPHFS